MEGCKVRHSFVEFDEIQENMHPPLRFKWNERMFPLAPRKSKSRWDRKTRPMAENYISKKRHRKELKPTGPTSFRPRAKWGFSYGVMKILWIWGLKLTDRIGDGHSFSGNTKRKCVMTHIFSFYIKTWVSMSANIARGLLFSHRLRWRFFQVTILKIFFGWMYIK